MQTLKISLLVYILSIIVSAQDGWFWQNPLPQGNTINDVDFFDEYFGIAVGYTSTIIKTSDGGLSWSLKESHRPENINKVDVVSDSVAYALGYSFIIKTTDSGENWFTITNPTNFYLSDIFFIDELQGYIVGSGGVIFYTSDGGNSWTNQISGINGILTAVNFLNENIGIAVGYNQSNYNNIVVKTTNGGINWSNFSFSPPPYLSFDDVKIITESKVLAISDEDILFSSNGGLNWSVSSIGSNPYFKSIAYYDSLNWFISGADGITNSGRIFRTSDGGINWQEVVMNLGNSAWLYGISSPTENLIYATGEFGRMVYSTDGGNTWEQRSSGSSNSFMDVSFYDENYGIAIGNGIFTTSDGGESWIQTATPLPLRRCTRPSLNLCFVTGGFDLLKSTDKGFTWIQHPISDDHYFMTISFADTLNGIASAMLGSQEKIFRTFDGGETWDQISSIYGHSIYDMCFVNSQIVYASTGSTKVFKSTDGGYTWVMQNTGVTGTLLYGIHFVNEQVGYTVGYPGKVIKTTNGGESWQLLYPNLGNGLDFYQVHFMDENNGLVGGDIVAHTSDGGQTWNGYDLSAENMRAAYMVNDSIWYAVGENGVILKTTSSGIVPVELFSFTATVNISEVFLNWSTATETNNSGFEILRFTQNDNGEWYNIGFVLGHGTTTETQRYSFTDNNVKPGKYQYKLKQIDYDGKFEYSQIVEVEIAFVNEFSLSQNYPNPFNPTTSLQYAIGSRQFVTLKVYDLLGREIATLVNEEKLPGEYEVEFNGANLPSGIYFYQLKAGQYSETKKMILLK